ncbi:MAG: hypothetical protein IPI87_19060 [Betaproteobacteria bacterium]|nr:hypothetical protein [Betaproteobacteria bacterium]
MLIAEVNLERAGRRQFGYEPIHLLHRLRSPRRSPSHQIHTLTIELDLVLNAIQDVATAVGMYNIRTDGRGRARGAGRRRVMRFSNRAAGSHCRTRRALHDGRPGARRSTRSSAQADRIQRGA